MKHRIEVSAEELERFVGPWSVPRKIVDVLLCEWERKPDAMLERDAGRAVRKYLTSVRTLVAELEVKLPDAEDLPDWRETAAFYERLAALAPPEPEQSAAPAVDPAADRNALARTLTTLLAK